MLFKISSLFFNLALKWFYSPQKEDTSLARTSFETPATFIFSATLEYCSAGQLLKFIITHEAPTRPDWLKIEQSGVIHLLNPTLS